MPYRYVDDTKPGRIIIGAFGRFCKDSESCQPAEIYKRKVTGINAQDYLEWSRERARDSERGSPNKTDGNHNDC